VERKYIIIFKCLEKYRSKIMLKVELNKFQYDSIKITRVIA